MKKTKKQVNADLPASLQVHLNGLNEKYARKLQKSVMKIVKKMSGMYADLLDKEVHAAKATGLSVAGAPPAPSARPSRPKAHRWTNL